ncbi:uncharacterized protein LOC127738940 [Mytilus californianus]|uniref:uncharacterized protein LOC127738940 n=1 Tax=Mytilus californianus TaxID=6549 RepID=UPI0022462699|nr:uncharacterized protein LOC127738940 [Mytilus californianus]
MDTIYKIALFSLCIQSCLSIKVTIMAPNKTGSEAAIVIVPDTSIPGAAYKPLAKVLQSRSTLRLWVVVLESIPSSLLFPIAFNGARKQLLDAGFEGDKVFLAGHGLGGQRASTYGHSPLHKNRLDGVLLFSSFLSGSYRLNKYPFPVLTISGDLDGITRVTKIVDAFEELEEDLILAPNQKYTTPVIVMEGINYGQFASGNLPPAVTGYDLKPEVSQKDAYDSIANYTNAFMLYVRNTNVSEAKSVLEEGYSNTQSILQPLSQVKALEDNEEYVSHWTNTAQQLIVNLLNTSLVEFDNTEETPTQSKSFRFHKPYHSDMLKINSSTEVYFPNTDGTKIPQSPLQLKATMTSQRAVKTLLPSAPFGDPATCQDINQDAFTLAFSKSSATAKSRYQSKGRPIKFLPDVNVTSKNSWNQYGDLQLNYNITGLFVQAKRYISTKPSGKDDDCTLLSPFRAMEWIYVDSLKYMKEQTYINST